MSYNSPSSNINNGSKIPIKKPDIDKNETNNQQQYSNITTPSVDDTNSHRQDHILPHEVSETVYENVTESQSYRYTHGYPVSSNGSSTSASTTSTTSNNPSKTSLSTSSISIPIFLPNTSMTTKNLYPTATTTPIIDDKNRATKSSTFIGDTPVVSALSSPVLSRYGYGYPRHTPHQIDTPKQAYQSYNSQDVLHGNTNRHVIDEYLTANCPYYTADNSYDVEVNQDRQTQQHAGYFDNNSNPYNHNIYLNTNINTDVHHISQNYNNLYKNQQLLPQQQSQQQLQQQQQQSQQSPPQQQQLQAPFDKYRKTINEKPLQYPNSPDQADNLRQVPQLQRNILSKSSKKQNIQYITSSSPSITNNASDTTIFNTFGSKNKSNIKSIHRAIPIRFQKPKFPTSLASYPIPQSQSSQSSQSSIGTHKYHVNLQQIYVLDENRKLRSFYIDNLSKLHSMLQYSSIPFPNLRKNISQIPEVSIPLLSSIKIIPYEQLYQTIASTSSSSLSPQLQLNTSSNRHYRNHQFSPISRDILPQVSDITEVVDVLESIIEHYETGNAYFSTKTQSEGFNNTKVDTNNDIDSNDDDNDNDSNTTRHENGIKYFEPPFLRSITIHKLMKRIEQLQEEEKRWVIKESTSHQENNNEQDIKRMQDIQKMKDIQDIQDIYNIYDMDDTAKKHNYSVNIEKDNNSNKESESNKSGDSDKSDKSDENTQNDKVNNSSNYILNTPYTNTTRQKKRKPHSHSIDIVNPKQWKSFDDWNSKTKWFFVLLNKNQIEKDSKRRRLNTSSSQHIPVCMIKCTSRYRYRQDLIFSYDQIVSDSIPIPITTTHHDIHDQTKFMYRVLNITTSYYYTTIPVSVFKNQRRNLLSSNIAKVRLPFGDTMLVRSDQLFNQYIPVRLNISAISTTLKNHKISTSNITNTITDIESDNNRDDAGEGDSESKSKSTKIIIQTLIPKALFSQKIISKYNRQIKKNQKRRRTDANIARTRRIAQPQSQSQPSSQSSSKSKLLIMPNSTTIQSYIQQKVQDILNNPKPIHTFENLLDSEDITNQYTGDTTKTNFTNFTDTINNLKQTISDSTLDDTFTQKSIQLFPNHIEDKVNIMLQASNDDFILPKSIQNTHLKLNLLPSSTSTSTSTTPSPSSPFSSTAITAPSSTISPVLEDSNDDDEEHNNKTNDMTKNRETSNLPSTSNILNTKRGKNTSYETDDTKLHLHNSMKTTSNNTYMKNKFISFMSSVPYILVPKSICKDIVRLRRINLQNNTSIDSFSHQNISSTSASASTSASTSTSTLIRNGAIPTPSHLINSNNPVDSTNSSNISNISNISMKSITIPNSTKLYDENTVKVRVSTSAFSKYNSKNSQQKQKKGHKIGHEFKLLDYIQPNETVLLPKNVFQKQLLQTQDNKAKEIVSRSRPRSRSGGLVDDKSDIWLVKRSIAWTTQQVLSSNIVQNYGIHKSTDQDSPISPISSNMSGISSMSNFPGTSDMSNISNISNMSNMSNISSMTTVSNVSNVISNNPAQRSHSLNSNISTFARNAEQFNKKRLFENGFGTDVGTGVVGGVGVGVNVGGNDDGDIQVDIDIDNIDHSDTDSHINPIDSLARYSLQQRQAGTSLNSIYPAISQNQSIQGQASIRGQTQSQFQNQLRGQLQRQQYEDETYQLRPHSHMSHISHSSQQHSSFPSTFTSSSSSSSTSTLTSSSPYISVSSKSEVFEYILTRNPEKYQHQVSKYNPDS